MVVMMQCAYLHEWLLQAYMMPAIKPGQVVKMWSSDFARWWLVCRLVETSNAVFMRNFRGTAILTEFYRFLVCICNTC